MRFSKHQTNQQANRKRANTKPTNTTHTHTTTHHLHNTRMASTTVRVSEQSRSVLRKLAEEKKISMVEALDEVTAFWEREQFFQAFNDSFATLKADSDAWQEELEERRLWDQTLTDDLNDESSAETKPG